VTRLKGEGPGPWVKETVQAAVEGRLFSVGDIVRVGDFLLRQGQAEAAALAAQDAVARCRGYLSAYVLAFKSALSQRDLKKALSAVLRGIEQADDPAPFYRAMVHLKSLERSSDTDMVSALEFLRQHFPDDRYWAEQLAYVYFQKGDAQRTLSVLSPVIEADVRGIRVQSLLVAAEAARMEGAQRQSVGILEAAHALYPERLNVLNNLVYVLAQDRATLKRARELLPALLQAGGDSYAVLDTAAMVHLRSGDLEKARQFMDQALNRMQDGSYGALEVGLNAAEILFRSGELDAARARLEKVRKDPRCPHAVVLGARRLLREIELAVRPPRG
jgi:Tfp pilus assembly protein PilF